MRLWYATAVGSLAVLPFLAPRLSDAGLGDAGAAWTLAALPLGTLLGGPIWAAAVERWGHASTLHRLAIGGSALWVLAVALPLPTWSLQLFIAGFAVSRSGVFPIADAATVHAVGPRYGSVRAVGSIGYIAAILLIGTTRDRWPTSPLLVGGGLLLAATWLAPRLPPLPPTPRSAGLGGLRDRRVLAVLGVALLNGFSITAYDHLFALHLERVGVSSSWTSVAIAWGVLVEVTVMFLGPRLLRRFDARWLLLLAVSTGIPRFALTAWSEQPAAIAALQGLHGLQFGLFWITSVQLLGRIAPPGRRRSVQALLPSAAFGVAPLVMLLAGGTWLRAGSTQVLFASLVLPCGLATLGAIGLLLDPMRYDAEGER